MNLEELIETLKLEGDPEFIEFLVSRLNKCTTKRNALKIIESMASDINSAWCHIKEGS